MTHAPDYILELLERETHSDTMRPLSPLERQHLEDWRRYFDGLCPYRSVHNG